MSDTLETIKCPACGEEMYKLYIPEKNINIDVCINGCGGIFFDNREFQMFDEQHEKLPEILKELENKELYIIDENLERKCPVCGAKMTKNYSSIKKEIQIDDCYNCGGKFLDYGELEKIRAEYKTDKDRADDVIKYLFTQVGDEINEAEIQGSISRTHHHDGKKFIDIVKTIRENL